MLSHHCPETQATFKTPKAINGICTELSCTCEQQKLYGSTKWMELVVIKKTNKKNTKPTVKYCGQVQDQDLFSATEVH